MPAFLMPASSIPHFSQKLVSWSLTSLFSTNMAISEATFQSENVAT